MVPREPRTRAAVKTEHAHAPPAVRSDREYEFSDADFRALRDLVKQITGINLAETKRELVYGRVSRRLRALGLSSFGEYRRLLRQTRAPIRPLRFHRPGVDGHPNHRRDIAFRIE